MRYRAFIALFGLIGCSSGAPCDPAFRWQSGISSSGDCELTLSHDAVVTFDVPQPTSCSAPVVVACGPGATCTRTCTTLTIVADATASKAIIDTLGTSNTNDVTTDLRCGELGRVQADVIIETSAASLQECSP